MSSKKCIIDHALAITEICNAIKELVSLKTQVSEDLDNTLTTPTFDTVALATSFFTSLVINVYLCLAIDNNKYAHKLPVSSTSNVTSYGIDYPTPNMGNSILVYALSIQVNDNLSLSLLMDMTNTDIYLASNSPTVLETIQKLINHFTTVKTLLMSQYRSKHRKELINLDEILDVCIKNPTNSQILTLEDGFWVNTDPPEFPTVDCACDITCPSFSSDLELVRFNGTSGKSIEGVGVRHYGISATDPITPTPGEGDLYYNNNINHLMSYDASRGKWLSVATLMDGSGRNGNTGAGTFYRRWNGMLLSNNRGPYIAKGTIIRIGYASSNAVNHTFEVLLDGVVVAELSSGGAASTFSDTFNVDFDAGILSSRNKAGGSTTSNFQSVIYYKLRA